MKVMMLFSLLSLFTFPAWAQAPQGINYQAVVRNSSGDILPNTSVSLQFKIRQGSASGSVIYAETHTLTSNAAGIVTAIVGQGTPSLGAFSGINWSTGVYYNEVLMDIAGGANYQSMGTAQLMSVPYALFANAAGTGSAGSGSVANAQQTLFIGANKHFLSATSEPNVDSFVYTASTIVALAKRDPVTGIYSSRIIASSLIGCANPNSSIYGATTHQGKIYYVLRDACGSVVYNGAGQAITLTGGFSGSGTIFSDGTYIYMHSNGSNWTKYSVSGTTFQDLGTINLQNTSADTKAIISDGMNFYFLRNIWALDKLNSSGVLVGGMPVNQSYSSSPPSGIIHIDNNRMFLLGGSEISLPATNNSYVVMSPVGKP